MSVDEALEAYKNLAGNVFGHPRMASCRGPILWPVGKYRSHRLEEAVKDVVHSQTIKKRAIRRRQLEQLPGDETFNTEPAMCKTQVLLDVGHHDRPS